MAGRGDGPDYAEELSLQRITGGGRQLNIGWAHSCNVAKPWRMPCPECADV